MDLVLINIHVQSSKNVSDSHSSETDGVAGRPCFNWSCCVSLQPEKYHDDGEPGESGECLLFIS